MAKKTSDETGLLRLMRGLFATTAGHGLIELRGIPVDREKQVRRKWVNNSSELVEWAEDLGRKDSGYSCYFGVCKRKTEAGRKQDILNATALWVDIDTVNHSWDTDKCLKAIHQLKGVLQPSAVIKSGGGLHCYWFLSEPHAADQRIEDANKALADMMSGDAVHDVTRVMRLPDTYNPKRKAKAELVWCYDFVRHDIDDLLDAVLSRPTVMYDGAWIKRADAEKRMASAVEKASTDDDRAEVAMNWARILKGGKVAEKSLDMMWATEVRYKPTRGYVGIDEAVMKTCARLWCSKSIQLKGTERVDEVVRQTHRKLKNFAVQWDGPTWNEQQQKEAIRRKLARWIPKWEAIKAQEALAKKRASRGKGE